MEIFEEVVGQSLLDVCPVQLKGHEHDASKNHNPEVNLADELMLLAPGPSEERVKPTKVLPGTSINFLFILRNGGCLTNQSEVQIPLRIQGHQKHWACGG